MKRQGSSFLSKIARKIQKRQQRKNYRRRQQTACQFQPLEPRKLLSADGLMTLAASAPRVTDGGVIQVQQQIRNIDSTWFEDLAPQITANADTSVSSLNWKGTNITTITDQWIIQLNNKALKQVQSVGDTFDLLNLDEYDGQVIRGLGMTGLVLIQTQTDMDTDTFMDVIMDGGWVDYIQPNAVLENQAVTPDDTYYQNLWGQNNTSQYTNSVKDADIDLPEAWEITTGSSNVVVGVIDTGVNYNHIDLDDNMWTNPGEIAGNGIDDDGNGFIDDIYGFDFINNDSDPMDDHGHGTHVAGTIAAEGNNGTGVTGVSWNSQIMALKFMGADGSGSTSDAVRAINYATMMKQTYGVNILITCNSWSGGGYSTSLYNAIVANQEAGMLFVAAAGNDAADNDANPQYPANYDIDNIISVAATDWKDNLSTFSNYGANTVDIAAPGTYIYSTTKNGGYGYMSGTSMAAPQIAGLAALAWSARPNATVQQIKEAILDGGDTIASLDGLISSGKRVNAYNTLDALSQSIEAIGPAISVTCNDGRDYVDPYSPFITEFYGSTIYDENTDYSVIEFEIYNYGDSDLILSSVSTTGPFVVDADIADTVLSPREKTTFTIRLIRDTAGEFDGTVSFTTNDPNYLDFTFNVFGIVEQGVETPAYARFLAPEGYEMIMTDYHVGEIAQGTTADYTFTVENTGMLPLTIYSSEWNNYFPGGWSIVEGLDSVIAGGSSDTFTVRMDTDTTGDKISYLTIYTSADNLYLQLEGRTYADGVPWAGVTAPNNTDINDDSNQVYDYGSVDAYTSSQNTFKIYNIGYGPLQISNLQVTGDFYIVSQPAASIDAGDNSPLIIAMDTTTSGAKTGTVSFDTNDPERTPYNFNIKGNVNEAPEPGVVELEVVDPNGADIQNNSSTPINFGSKTAGVTVKKSFTVTNSGDDTMVLYNLIATGDFSIVTDLPATLAAGKSATFIVKMDTSAAGDMSGSISFNSNDTDESTFTFLVEGTVTPAPLPAELTVTYSEGEILDDQTTVDFGTVDYGADLPMITITITNTGETPLATSSLKIGSGFTILGGLDPYLMPGESDSFLIGMPTTSAGEKNATVTFHSTDDDENVFTFNVTGNVAAPPDGIDLSVAWADDVDAYIIPGVKSKVTVDVTNNGTITMSDSVTINIYGNTTQTLDGGEILLGTITKSLTLKPDQIKTNRIVIELDGEIPADDYYLFAVVDPDDTITESNEDNNDIVTSNTTEIAWKFGDLGDGKKTTLKLEDADGSLVQFSISGKGVGEVVENADGSWSVYITGTTNATKINISGKGGDDRVQLRDLIIGDPDNAEDNTVIGQLAGKNVDINGGDFLVTGTIQKLILGNINDATMTFNGMYGRGSDITLDQLSDVTINAQTGFNNFSIIDWTDTDSVADEFNAFWVNKLSSKGSKKLNNNGDFQTNLNLTGYGSRSYTLDTMVIKGAMNDHTMDITGNVKLIKIDSVEDSDFNITGDVDKMILGHMLNGSLTAGSIDKLSTSGATNIADSNGDFTADLDITGTKTAKYSLKTASIKGDITDADWTIAGKVSSLVVKGDTSGLTLSVVDDSELRLEATLEKLILADVADTDVNVEGNIDLVKAQNWTDGSITADAITVVKVDGTMTGDINLLGNDARGDVLKSMTVKGDVTDVDWDMVGQVGKVQLNGTVDGLELDILDGEDHGQEASIEKLVLADVTSSDVTVEGEIQYIKADTWDDGSITAEDILKSNLPD